MKEKTIKFKRYSDFGDEVPFMSQMEAAQRSLDSRMDRVKENARRSIKPIFFPAPELQEFYDRQMIERLNSGAVLQYTKRVLGDWKEPTRTEKIKRFFRKLYSRLEAHVGAEPEYDEWD